MDTRKKKKGFFIPLVAIILSPIIMGGVLPVPPNGGLFERIAPSQSGIQFSNTLKENVSTRENLLDFDYFYNGGGVGIADINNDGLADIFFAGNQQANALYLNKGNMTFEDISERAGINQGKQWANGVTFADVNSDGLLDIYVSQGGPKGTPLNGEDRKNLLFINQGDLRFSEEAEAYGLADPGISTQAIFFDYDKDGDLDCLVGNENYLFGMPPTQFYSLLRQRRDLLAMSSSHLYRNNGGKFQDVSLEAKVLRPSFALGPIVSDLNNDGWLDIYFSNDYFIPDYVYINQKDGTFKDESKERFAQVSFYGMGVDIADINNDGHREVYVLDMASSDHYRSKTLMRSMNVDNFRLLVDRLKFNHQYMFNSLQLNKGNGTYQNIGHFSGTAKTDWSWSALIADYDMDGNKDIFVTNGYRRYALDNDFQQKVTDTQKAYQGKVPQDVKRELYQQMPSEKLGNYLFRNKGDLQFENVALAWGIGEPSFSNGAAYADLDNDGDLDLVVNNIDDPAFVYKNLSREQSKGNYLKVKPIGQQSESFATIHIQVNGQNQSIETKRVRGYLSSMPTDAVFGIGEAETVDTVRITWPSGKYEEQYQVKANSTLTVYERNAKLPEAMVSTAQTSLFEALKASDLGLHFRHKENAYDDFAKEILLPYQQSTLGPFVTVGDINGDAKDDFFVGGASGQPGQLFVQSPSGFKNVYVGALEADKKFEDMEAALADFDNDGDKDLFVVSGGNAYEGSSDMYADRLYWNDGKGRFTKAQEGVFSLESGSGKTVAAIDIDRDGDKDLVVGNRIIPQSYPQSAPSKVYRNEGGKFVDVSWEVAPDLLTFGIVNKIINTDFDKDGWTDMIVVGEWTHIGLFKNVEGVFRDIAANSNLDTYKGWWFNVGETDINNDGLPDYLVGNVGLNSKFTASQEKAFKVFANDFDNNGSLDIVLSKKQDGTYLPVRGRECSSQQMPFITEKFPTYHDFAIADIEDIYGDALEGATEHEATTFASVLLVNQGNGDFSVSELPGKAQLFPILSAVFPDVNGDGINDAILMGNIYHTEVETPRLDAGNGLVLISNGRDNYTEVASQSPYNLHISGNAKDIKILTHAKYPSLLLATRNNGPLATYQIRKNKVKAK